MSKKNGSPYLYFMDLKLRQSRERGEALFQRMVVYNQEWQQTPSEERIKYREAWKKASAGGKYRTSGALAPIIRRLCGMEGNNLASRRKIGSANKLIIPKDYNEWFDLRQADQQALLDRWWGKHSSNPLNVLADTFVVLVVSNEMSTDVNQIEVSMVLFSFRSGIQSAIQKLCPKNPAINNLVSFTDDLELVLFQRLYEANIFTPSLNYIQCEEKVKDAQVAKYPENDSFSVKVFCIEDLIEALITWLKNNHHPPSGIDHRELTKQGTTEIANIMCGEHLENMPSIAKQQFCALQWAAYSASKAISVVSQAFPELNMSQTPNRFFSRRFHIKK